MSSRLVHQRFSSAYLATEEVSIEKKTIFIEEFATHVNLVIWDIGDFSMDMGIPESCLLGAHWIIWVVDLKITATRIWF